MNPRISIIITCYNLGLYLEEAISSIIDYPNLDLLEIIVVNDGSTKLTTIEILNKIKRTYGKVIIIDQKNQGLAKARNNGIIKAKGEYIIPLDADNKLRHKFIENSIELLDNNNTIELVYGNANFFDQRKGLWKMNEVDIEEMVLNNQIDACACFRKSTWEALEGYDENMPYMGFEDWDLWLRMIAKGMEFKYVNAVFFDYRVRENSMITQAWSKRKDLVGYIFNKPELKILKLLRTTLIANRELRQELPLKEIGTLLKVKIYRKIGLKKTIK